MDSYSPTLLLSTAPFFRQPVRRAFEVAARSGFEGVEIMVSQDPDTQSAEGLLALADEFDIKVGAIHAPFLVFTRRVWGTDPIGKVERAIDLASSVGAPTVIAHPPYRWQDSYRRWLTNEATAEGERAGVVVTVENMFPLPKARIAPHGHHRIDQFDRYPDLTLDTSHAAVSGLDLLEISTRHASRLRHVHLSNNPGRGWDSHLPVDEGVLPLPEFLETLADGHFPGSISLELNLRPWFSDATGMLELLTSNRRFCERRMPALV